MKKPPESRNAIDPEWATKRHESWCGMTRSEVDAWIEERRINREQEHLLYHWVPRSVPN